jgi:hypothetical protein
MPNEFGGKLRFKWGDLTVMVWKEKQNVNLLINMHCPSAEGNFYDG